MVLRPELVQQQPNGELVIDIDGGTGDNQSMVHVHLAKMTNGMIALGTFFFYQGSFLHNTSTTLTTCST